METKSIVGLFQRNGESLKILDELKDVGFVEESFLIEKNTDDVYLFSVAVDNVEQLEKARTVFQEWKPYHVYEFPFVAEKENRIRAYVEASAKTQIFNLPHLKKHGAQKDGLNSEVIIGKS